MTLSRNWARFTFCNIPKRMDFEYHYSMIGVRFGQFPTIMCCLTHFPDKENFRVESRTWIYGDQSTRSINSVLQLIDIAISSAFISLLLNTARDTVEAAHATNLHQY